MTKSDLLNSSAVQQLVDYIVDLWSKNDKATFKIGIKTSNRAKAIYKKFNSLKEVGENYLWSYSVPKHLLSNPNLTTGSDMNKNEQIFTEAAALLLKDKELNSDESQLRNGSELILRWGGVINGNKARIESTDLVEKYSLVIKTWNDINQQNKAFSALGKSGFVSNAGFTKIYSIILPDFVIYDSRVAVALAYIIEKCFPGEIPDMLSLFIPSPKTDNLDMRKTHDFFRKTNSSDARHFYSNCLASIILKLVIDKINASMSNKYSMRDLEAALFMMGYDLRGHNLTISTVKYA
jgi:hypothetical protein